MSYVKYQQQKKRNEEKQIDGHLESTILNNFFFPKPDNRISLIFYISIVVHLIGSEKVSLK